MKKLLHYFIPHPETHEKAHLLSWHFLIIYILIFILLKISIDLVGFVQPGVLGVDSNITVQNIIEGTNQERQKMGLTSLTENQALNKAAYEKAKNMFAENYWAHFSPSGKDPWGFILGSGYKFSYAGENLARNFSNSSDVVTAWMNSPTHKDNILNSNYQDIGIAVVDGTLNGQKTTLVVQMFGKAYQPIASAHPAQVNIGGQKIAVPASEINKNSPVLALNSDLSTKLTNSDFVINPFVLSKTVGLSLITLIAMLLILDFIILKRRGVFRLSSHHLTHLSFLAASGASLLLTKTGEIL